MKRSLAIIALIFTSIACLSQKEVGMEGASETKDVTIVLPELKNFSEDPALLAKLNFYHLNLQSSSGCKDVGGFSLGPIDSLVISRKIQKDCEYEITLKLGEKAIDVNAGLGEIYYEGSASLKSDEIASQIIANGKVILEITLYATEVGKNLGFKGAVKTAPKPDVSTSLSETNLNKLIGTWDAISKGDAAGTMTDIPAGDLQLIIATDEEKKKSLQIIFWIIENGGSPSVYGMRVVDNSIEIQAGDGTFGNFATISFEDDKLTLKYFDNTSEVYSRKK
mgnify:CR=1 FL=1